MLLHTLYPLCCIVGSHDMVSYRLYRVGELSCLSILKNVLMGSYMFSFLGHIVSVSLTVLFLQEAVSFVLPPVLCEKPSCTTFLPTFSVIGLFTVVILMSMQTAQPPSFIINVNSCITVKNVDSDDFHVSLDVGDCQTIYSVGPNLSSDFSMRTSHQIREPFFLS